MGENKVLTYLGIILAVDFWAYSYVSTWQLVLVTIGTLIACILLSKIEYLFCNSRLEWIDYIFYIFSKNKKNYTVVDKISTYHVKDDYSATYNVNAKVKSKTAGDFIYEGRYCWDQKDVNVELKNPTDANLEEIQDYKWSKVLIRPTRIVHKRDLIPIEYTATNLIINDLKKHTFISCKVVEKIKHLKLVAKVDSSLNPPDEAYLVIERSDGEEIGEAEKILYNKQTGTYEKTIPYPRRGRKYILKWFM